MQALFTCAGLALATGILVIPNAFRDGVAEIMDFQWDVVQRHDLSLGFVEPSSAKARHAVENLPGVVQVEPFRYAVARLRFGQHRRRVVVQGLPAEALHSRVVGDGYRRLRLSGDGLVVSAKLAEVLHARVGDLLTVEFLEGRRQVRSVPLIGLAQDFAGVAAYVDLAGLNRLLGEGEVISGATVRVDGAARAEFLKRLKEVPRVSWVAIKDSLRANFRRTTAASINLIQTIYLVFATVVAFGVVYNNARISLAERARELATLRVIGFTQSEVGAILVTELVLLGLLAVPVGLVMGTGFATLIIGTVNTETVRVPLILTSGNYAFAAATVAVASTVSAFLVLRRLARLNLVGVLKAPE